MRLFAAIHWPWVSHPGSGDGEPDLSLQLARSV